MSPWRFSSHACHSFLAASQGSSWLTGSFERQMLCNAGWSFSGAMAMAT